MLLLSTKPEDIQDFSGYWRFGITINKKFQGNPYLGGHGSRKQKEAG
jgi:hypothetical protein